MKKFLTRAVGLLLIEGIGIALLLGIVARGAKQLPPRRQSVVPRPPQLSLTVPRATLRAGQSLPAPSGAAGSW